MRLLSDLKVNMKLNESLARYTSFKIGGQAHFYASPSNVTELLYVLKFRASEGLPMFVLGGGSNTLFSDKGYAGLVLSMLNFERDFVRIQGNRVRVSCGTLTHQLVTQTREESLGGLEFLANLPGTVGGALIMNAGFGKDERGKCQEISNALVEVSFLDSKGDFQRLKRSEINFGYRSSDLGGNLLLEAVFELKPNRPERIQKTIQKNMDYRKRVQDWNYPSAGSVFKNPTHAPLSVGEMVERLCLKGTQVGGAQISPIHGNFIINKGEATARDVLELIELIQDKVFREFRVKLETEIKYIDS